MATRPRHRVAYGLSEALERMVQRPIIANRNPTTADQAELGTFWVNSATGTFFGLASITAGSSNWVTTPAAGATVVASLQVTGAGGVTVDVGDIDVTLGDINVPAGNVTVGGDLTVQGVATFNGDFDLTSALLIDLTSTLNAAPSILLHANGGINEQILLHSDQGTAVDSVSLLSDVGGITVRATGNATADAINLEAPNGGIDIDAGLQINIDSAQAAATAIRIIASDAAGGIDIDYGTGGMAVTGTNGAFNLETGTGAINLGADAAAHTITIGNITGATAVVVNTGTGGYQLNTTGAGDVDINASNDFLVDAVNLFSIDSAVGSNVTVTGASQDLTLSSVGGSVIIDGSEAAADALQLAASDAAGGITVDYGTGGMAVTGANGAFDLETGTGAINIGADAVAHAITIGNNTGATSVAINAGTAGAGAINIGTTANDVPIVIGNVTGATAVTVNTGTGDFQVNTTGLGDVDINASNDFLVDAASTFSIDSAVDSNITVTGAGQDLTLSSAGGSVIVDASEAALDAIQITASNAAGGVIISSNGEVEVVPGTGTIASPTSSATINTRVIVATFTGFTTGTSASQTFTINSNKILATSGVMVNVTNLDASTNGAFLTIDGIIQAAGSVAITVTNNGAGALGAGDSVLISVWVLS